MHDQQLPETYQGFATQELLEMWKQLEAKTLNPMDCPSDKLRVTREFIMEYELSPVAQAMRALGHPHTLTFRRTLAGSDDNGEQA